MEQAWEKYWPSLLGGLVLVVTAIFLWPSEKEEKPLVIQAPPSPARTPNPHSDSDSADASPSPRGTLPVAPPPPRMQLVETVVAVPLEANEVEPKTYDQDDPEVKEALAAVEIELYGAAECADCEAAQRFLEHNQLRFQQKDVGSDSWIQETLRRRAGTTDVPVLIVDGQVVRGFSVESLQGALTQAVKKRVTAEE